MGQPQQQPVAEAVMIIASANTANLFIVKSFPHCLVSTADGQVVSQHRTTRADGKNR